MTEQRYWETLYDSGVKPRLPSSLNVGVWNAQRLLRREIRPGQRVIEIGCAPGKILAWCAKALGAQVAGVDYSARGIAQAKAVFEGVGIAGDLRCEDVVTHTFGTRTFDVAYSFGVIEHFDDPYEVVRAHIELVRPGGTALMAVPNYAGAYGMAQRWFDPENLAIHNVRIMHAAALRATVPAELAESVGVFSFGRVSPWLVSWERRMPRPLARGVALVLNGAGRVQPFDIARLAPWLVLRIVRGSA